MLKKTAIIGLIAIIHFALCVGIVPGTMTLVAGYDNDSPAPSAFFRLLVVATTVLHYPIISLALYSRHWFPGNWIYVPIGMNSLLWGIALYFGGAVYLKLRKRRS
ncbi:MAG: hypothetical protein JRF72_11825 [Deltaproteobacteria bacterium]|jgi:hypothetical protein|nr:hypothetical protein [Deltaproteobacteria bacterium]